MPSGGAPSGVRILLAGRTPEITTARRLLEDAGHRVRVEHDGLAALAALERAPFELAIVEWRGAGLDGTALCRAIRARSALSALHVIVLSPIAPSRPALQALAAGADDYLVLPFAPAQLLARVRAGVQAVRLRASEGRLRALVANVPGAIYRCANDPDWTMELVSDEIERISGYPPSDFIASARRTYASVIHPDDREPVERAVAQATASGRPFVLEYRIVRSDGGVVWVHERGQLGRAGDGRDWLDGVIFEISERRRVEDALGAHKAQESARLRVASLAEVEGLAEEQVALRRVATLVAASPAPERVFECVTEEVGRLLGVGSAAMVRYDSPATATVVGRWEVDGRGGFQVGAVVPLEGDIAIARVRLTGEPARVDGYATRKSGVARELHRLGFDTIVAAPVCLNGDVWGAVVVGTGQDEPMPAEAERRLSDFAHLVDLALGSAAARARIVEAGDAERRRLERDLHDGAQQRLVSLSLSLRLAESRLGRDDSAAAALLSEAQRELALALAELRELARGIHPAVLSERGLAPALEALADRSAVPVTLLAVPRKRLPERVEVAAYYVAAECLTNVAKYAGATAATVRVVRAGPAAVVEIADDGAGGADPKAGSGLRGLVDRVEALGGRLEIESPPGQGTLVRARVPLA